jgi:uncharacterized membrane protein
MGRALALGACVWLALLGFALWQRIHEPSALPGVTLYLVASRICHQIAERSFHTAGEQWPVCARCAGLYLAAPFGAWFGLRAARQRPAALRAVRLLAMAAVPTILTVVAERLGAPFVGNAARFVAALPLGAAIAMVIVEMIESERASPLRRASR